MSIRTALTILLSVVRMDIYTVCAGTTLHPQSYKNLRGFHAPSLFWREMIRGVIHFHPATATLNAARL